MSGASGIMSAWFIGFILMSVSLTAIAQLLMKAGMSAPAMQAVLNNNPTVISVIIAVISSPFIVSGIFCFGISVLVWLFVLSKIDVSQAYPFIALGLVITAVGGNFFFNEQLDFFRIAGIITIVIGIILVSQSSA